MNEEMTITEALNQLGVIIDNLFYCGVLEDEEEEMLNKIEIVLANYVKSKGDM